MRRRGGLKSLRTAGQPTVDMVVVMTEMLVGFAGRGDAADFTAAAPVRPVQRC